MKGNSNDKGMNLTHTKILCYAMRAVDREIADREEKCRRNNELNLIETYTKELRYDREALKALYFIETGVEYDL